MVQKRAEQKRKSLVYTLDYYCKEANKIDANATQHEIKNRIEKLQVAYEKFKTVLEQLENIDAYDFEPDIEQNMKTENEYIQALSRLQSFLVEEELIPNEQPIHQSTFIAHDYIQQQFDIPKFGGNFEDWKSFKELFTAAALSTRLSDAQKMQKLKNLLLDDAFKSIRHLSITADNFRVAMRILNDRYENKRACVNKLLRLFFDMPKIVDASSKPIQQIINTTNECLYSLNALNINTDSWGPIIVFFIEMKFDRNTFHDWEYFLKGSTEIPTINQMMKFLETQSRMFESVERNAMHEKSIIESMSNASFANLSNVNIGASTSKANDVPSNAGAAANTFKPKCSLCSDFHRLFECSVFRAKSIEERQKFVREKGLCLNCFSNIHKAAACRSRYSCLHCGEKHNALLHVNKSTAALAQVDANDGGNEHQDEDDNHSTTEELSSFHTQANVTQTNSHVLLGTAMAFVRLKKGTKELKVRCLLDNCAQASFVSENVTQLLKLKKRKASVSVNVVGNNSLGKIKHIVDFELVSSNRDFSHKVSALVVKSVSAIRETPKISKREWSHLEGLDFADPNYHRAGCIDVLLSAEIYAIVILDGLRKGPIGSPISQATELGWVVTGPADNTRSAEIVVAHASIDEIDANLRKFWEIEEIARNPDLSAVENEAEAHFVNTHRREESGQFIVRLPFKNGERPSFVGTRRRALRRLIQSENSLKKRPELQKEYNKSIQEFIDLNHVEMSEHQGKNENNGFFMSHHAVLKATSSTTKVRPVFDASAKDDHGNSLNDCLIAGPPIQPKLSNVLTNWRSFKYVLTADLEKMYRIIKVDERDIKYQQFVWRPDAHGAIMNLTHNRLTFGTANAAFQAVRCIKQLAIDEKDDFPYVAENIIKSSYIDDIYMGADTIDQLISLKNDLISFFERGCFSLRKWASNTNVLLEGIPEADREIACKIVTENDMMRTLGVRWYPYSDQFTFAVNFNIDENKCTKRNFLSQISKIFDPLGFLACFTVTLKMIMQDLWAKGIDWDEIMPKKMVDMWKNIQSECHLISGIRVPRWYGIDKIDEDVMLIGFCDASARACACVLYLRRGPLHHCNMTLVCARTKLAPIGYKTIPKLELNAAVMLAETAAEMRTTIGIDQQKVALFTDSQVVIAWIQGDINKWNKYVQSRVDNIRKEFAVEQWSYVASKENPADIASRGITPAKLKDNALWFNGPDWCRNPMAEWPSSSNDIDINKLTESGLAVHATVVINEALVEIMHRFSSYNSLYICTAYIRRYIEILRQRVQSPKEQRNSLSNSVSVENATHIAPITLDEKNMAIRFWVKFVQQCEFAEDMDALYKRNQLPAKSRLLDLYPFIDGNGILRVSGRLQHASIAYDAKHPMILPKKGHLTNLIIDDAHSFFFHGGEMMTLSRVRIRFWIMEAKSAIKSYLRNCVRCAITGAKLQQQLMGSLPVPRITQAHCFAHVGIDFIGPLEVRAHDLRKAPRQKAYVCIFKCMVTRAIDLELVKGVSTDDFLTAFRRFTARRGLCSDIYSDNGLCFVGAKNELPKMMRESMSNQTRDIVNELLKDDIKFHFSPPRSPTFGGIFESEWAIFQPVY